MYIKKRHLSSVILKFLKKFFNGRASCLIVTLSISAPYPWFGTMTAVFSRHFHFSVRQPERSNILWALPSLWHKQIINIFSSALTPKNMSHLTSRASMPSICLLVCSAGIKPVPIIRYKLSFYH
nr:MAG TPA: hypothetical protein [Caudoviricetes sp.]